MKKSHKEWSKLDWTRSDGELPSNEQIQLGCLQRIADATEKMAQPFIRMANDLAWCRQRIQELEAKNKHLQNQITGHKASFTKLKNKIASNDENKSEATL